VRSRRGGHAKNKVQSIISTDVIISATRHPPPASCWHEIWPGGLHPPWASPAPMSRRKPSSGTGTRLRAPVVILGFAEYGLFSVYKSSVFLLLYRQTIELLRSFSFALNTSWCLAPATQQVSGSSTQEHTWEHIVK